MRTNCRRYWLWLSAGWHTLACDGSETDQHDGPDPSAEELQPSPVTFFFVGVWDSAGREVRIRIECIPSCIGGPLAAKASRSGNAYDNLATHRAN
jgi:hypothetical protein